MASVEYRYEVRSHSRWSKEFCLFLKEEEAVEVQTRWEEIEECRSETSLRFFEQNGESWTLFLKRKEGDTLSLLAHPADREWVATVALSDDHLSKGIELIKKREGFSLDKWGALVPPSNFNLVLTFSD